MAHSTDPIDPQPGDVTTTPNNQSAPESPTSIFPIANTSVDSPRTSTEPPTKTPSIGNSSAYSPPSRDPSIGSPLAASSNQSSANQLSNDDPAPDLSRPTHSPRRISSTTQVRFATMAMEDATQTEDLGDCDASDDAKSPDDQEMSNVDNLLKGNEGEVGEDGPHGVKRKAEEDLSDAEENAEEPVAREQKGDGSSVSYSHDDPMDMEETPGHEGATPGHFSASATADSGPPKPSRYLSRLATPDIITTKPSRRGPKDLPSGGRDEATAAIFFYHLHDLALVPHRYFFDRFDVMALPDKIRGMVFLQVVKRDSHADLGLNTVADVRSFETRPGPRQPLPVSLQLVSKRFSCEIEMVAWQTGCFRIYNLKAFQLLTGAIKPAFAQNIRSIVLQGGSPVKAHAHAISASSQISRMKLKYPGISVKVVVHVHGETHLTAKPVSKFVEDDNESE